MPPRPRLTHRTFAALASAATVPAALLLAYGLSYSFLGKTPIHHSIDVFWHGRFGVILDALWHPAVILGGLLIALVVSGGPFLKAGIARRDHVAVRLGWYGWVLNLSITIFAATLMAAILLYLFVENAAPPTAG